MFSFTLLLLFVIKPVLSNTTQILLFGPMAKPYLNLHHLSQLFWKWLMVKWLNSDFVLLQNNNLK